MTSAESPFVADDNVKATNYYCACQTPSSYGAEGTCGPNAFFVSTFLPFVVRRHADWAQGFYHTPQAAVSGLTRRQEREELVAMNDAEKLYCPRGWTACLVEGAEDDTYEVCPSYLHLTRFRSCTERFVVCRHLFGSRVVRWLSVRSIQRQLGQLHCRRRVSTA